MKARSSGFWWLFISASAAALSIMALGGTLVYRASLTQEIRKQTATNCVQVEALKAAITGVLRDARDSSLSRPGLTLAAIEQIGAYYRRQLERFEPNKCPGA